MHQSFKHKAKKNRFHILVKLGLVIIMEFILLLVINLVSAYVGYSPHTVLIYILAGSLLAFFSSVVYDKKLKPRYSPVELEVLAIKWFLFRKFGVTAEEWDAEVAALDQELNGDKAKNSKDIKKIEKEIEEEIEKANSKKGG